MSIKAQAWNILGAVFFLLLLADSAPAHEDAPANSQGRNLQLVVLIDTNPNQTKVLPLELELASGVVGLSKQDTVISIITFGSKKPILRVSNAEKKDAIDALKNMTAEQNEARPFPVYLREATNLALGQYPGIDRQRSLLIIAEGRENFDGGFKQIVTMARELKVRCYVALVANHSLRGSKSVLMYGFDLSELARKTRGKCIEIENHKKKILQATQRFSESIAGQ